MSSDDGFTGVENIETESCVAPEHDDDDWKSWPTTDSPTSSLKRGEVHNVRSSSTAGSSVGNLNEFEDDEMQRCPQPESGAVTQASIRRAHTISGKLSSKEYRRKIPFLKGVHKGARANSERQNLRHVNEADKVHCEKDTTTAGADACHSSKDREMHYKEDAATPGVKEVKHSKKAHQLLIKRSQTFSGKACSQICNSPGQVPRKRQNTTSSKAMSSLAINAAQGAAPTAVPLQEEETDSPTKPDHQATSAAFQTDHCETDSKSSGVEEVEV